MKPIPMDKWVWLARPAHFICGNRCQFRLGTVIGNVIVSTVGDMRMRYGDVASTQIGCDRTHETMVFKVGGRCECGCGEPRIASGAEIDYLPANSDKEARANHMKLCHKYAKAGGAK